MVLVCMRVYDVFSIGYGIYMDRILEICLGFKIE